MVTADVLRSHGQDPDAALMSVARDLMQRPVTVSESTDLHTALVVMMRHSLREVMVAEKGRIVGFLDEAEIGRVYHDATVHDAEGATAETAGADDAETGAASPSDPGTTSAPPGPPG